MFKKLKKAFRRSGRSRLLKAQVAELSVAVAALMHKEVSSDDTVDGSAAVERVLIHAAKAKVESETIKALYGSLASRVAVTEQRIEVIKEQIRALEENS